MSILKNILSTIEKDGVLLEEKVENIITGGVTVLENTILPAAIKITTAAQTILDDDSSDIIGSLASKAGPAIEDEARKVLDEVVPELQLAQQFKTLATPNDVLTAVLKEVGQASQNVKTNFWIEFSGMVTNAFAQGKLGNGVAVQLAQFFYQNYPKSEGGGLAATNG